MSGFRAVRFNLLPVSGIRTSGSKSTKTGLEPVPNRFRTGFGLKTGTKTGSKPVWNRFGTGFGRFGQFGSGHSKSGRLYPVFRRLKRLKTGRYIRFSDV